MFALPSITVDKRCNEQVRQPYRKEEIMNSTKMLPRSVTILLCVALAAILFAVWTGPVFAAEEAQTANAPMWFKFVVGKVEDQHSSDVTVNLRNQAACGGQFQVFSGGGWSYWGTPEAEDWIGVGSNEERDDTYQWAGNLVPGSYYVRLGTGAHLPCALGVSGEGVRFDGPVNYGQYAAKPQIVLAPSPAIANPAPVQPSLAVIRPAAIPAAQTVDLTKIKPAGMAVHMSDMAMAPNSWMPVHSNEAMIFSFNVGRVPDESNSYVSVILYGEPYRAGEFQIFSEGGATVAEPEPESWMAHSYEEDGEYPSWFGALSPGFYQVRVEPQGMRDCRLAVTGQGVSY